MSQSISQFCSYLFSIQYDDWREENLSMQAWRHTVGRISIVASAAIVTIGVALHYCKIALESLIVTLTAGRSEHISDALTFDSIQEESKKVTSIAKEFSEKQIDDWFTPTKSYINCLITPFVAAVNILNLSDE